MKTAKNFNGFGLCVVVALALATRAPGGAVTFDDEALFLLASGPLNLESFEGNFATNSFTSNTILTPDITFTVPDFDLGIWNMPFVGGFATDGVNWLGYQSTADETITLNFNQAINGFGINITDWGDFGTGILTFSNDVGDFFQVDVTPNADGDHQFFGVINVDMLFTQVEFTQTIPGEFYGLDEIYYGLVPAPGAAALLAGLAVLTRRRRRRRG